MKDFFDLWFLSRKFPFEGEMLKDAITRTFVRREMLLPTTVPVALTPEFAALKANTWAMFIRRDALAPIEMTATLDVIHAFAWPVMAAAANAVVFNECWPPEEGWAFPMR